MADASPQHPPEFIKLLAHDLRWSLLRVLVVGDYRVNELVDLTGQPMNLVSYHLKKLRDMSVVTTRRSEADERNVYYGLDLDRVRDLYSAAGQALHPMLSLETALLPDRSNYTAPSLTPEPAHHNKKRVLIVCTHNSARSQMAEGLMRAMGGEFVDVYSAGSHPTRLHPDAVNVMTTEMEIDITGQEALHLSVFEGQAFDFVITVCDRAREVCPRFPGGVQIHWGFSDPTVIEEDAERAKAFTNIAKRLHSRISYFLSDLSN